MNIQDYSKLICGELEKEGILNCRISQKLSSVKNSSTLNHFYKKFVKDKKEILQLANTAKKNNIHIEDDITHVIANLDKFDIKTFRKNITDRLFFLNRQNLCIKRLKKTAVPMSIIQSIAEAKTITEIDVILDKLSPMLLIKAGILKTKHGESHLTTKSIKPINTAMRD